MCQRLLFLPLLAIFALPGCESASTPAAKADKASADAKTDRTAEVKLEVVKYDELQKALKGLQGRIVVVDVWATWCQPCVEEFPHLVELHERRAKEGVIGVSLSLDEPKKRDAALTFLKSKKAAFPNYLLDEGESGVDKLDLKSIPAVFVYDPDGKLVRKFTRDDPDNPFTYADVNKLVDELLARKK